RRRDPVVAQVAEALLEEVRAGELVEVLAERLPGHGQAVEVEEISNLEHHLRNAARVVEVLDRIVAGRFHVRDDRYTTMDPIEVVERELDAQLARDRRQVKERVRRAADRRVHGHRVLEGFAREDLPRRDAAPNEIDDPLSCRSRVPKKHGERRGAERGAWKREPERLREALARRGRSHELAGPA